LTRTLFEYVGPLPGLGKYGHLSRVAPTAGPDGAAGLSAMLIAQWCLPSRRQQLGRLSFEGVSANSAGVISEKLNISARSIAQACRTQLSYSGNVGRVKLRPSHRCIAASTSLICAAESRRRAGEIAGGRHRDVIDHDLRPYCDGPRETLVPTNVILKKVAFAS
jgi:hypothetical protein